MSILKQFSRIQHHTITDGDLSFTIPPNEDFTSGSWSSTDLVKSEFGINEANKTVFVRIGDEIIPLGGSGSSATLQQVVNNGNELNGLITNTGSVAINYTPEENFQNLFIQGDLSFINDSPYTNRGSGNTQQMIDPGNPSYSVGVGWFISESVVIGSPTSSFTPTISLTYVKGPSDDTDTETPTLVKLFTLDQIAFSLVQVYEVPTTGVNESAAILMTRGLDLFGNTSSILSTSTQKTFGTYSWISRNDLASGETTTFNNMEVSQLDENGNTIVRNRVWVDKEKVQIETGEFQMNNKVGFTGTFSSSGLWEFENGILISFTGV